MIQGNLGNLALNPRGVWDNTVQYERLDMVSHSGVLWAAVGRNQNSAPAPNNPLWQGGGVSAEALAVAIGMATEALASAEEASTLAEQVSDRISLATVTTPGIVKPDGVTTEVDPTTGALSAKGGARLLSLDYSLTGALADGYLFLGVDNGILTRGAFKEAYAQLVQDKANGGAGILDGEVAWQVEKAANDGKCAKFMLDESNETFRVPFIPGLFFRDGTAGGYHIDTMRIIATSATVPMGITAAYKNANFANSPIKKISVRSANTALTSIADSNFDLINWGVDTGNCGPHFSGDETQPENASYPVMIKMYGVVTNAGSADIAALIQLVTGKVDVDELNRRLGYVVLYPGGTEANPGTIGVNQRVVASNPLAPRACVVVAEVRTSSSAPWGTTGWIYSTGGQGVVAAMLGTDSIVIQTGSYVVASGSNIAGGSLGIANAISTPIQYRVKLFLIGS